VRSKRRKLIERRNGGERKKLKKKCGITIHGSFSTNDVKKRSGRGRTKRFSEVGLGKTKGGKTKGAGEEGGNRRGKGGGKKGEKKEGEKNAQFPSLGNRGVTRRIIIKAVR